MNLRRLRGCALALAAWLSATGAIGTCNFFKPAVPEAPKGVQIIGDYSSPTKTLETLAQGIDAENARNGQSIFMQAFADSNPDGRAYHAFFDLRDLIEHPGWGDNDWDRVLESQLFTSLVTSYSKRATTWELYPPAGNEQGTPNVDSLVHRKYQIFYVSPAGDSIRVATGAADLYFVRSPNAGNHWVIARWQDFHTVDADVNQTTLGKLRLETQN